MADKKMTRRAQTAMAHLYFHGEFHSHSFPLGDSDKYLGSVATEVRRALVNAGSTVAPYRLPSGRRGYIIVPFEAHDITGAVHEAMKAFTGISYYLRELKRLGAEPYLKELNRLSSLQGSGHPQTAE